MSKLASQVESELFDDLALLARSPGIGHKRQDLTKVSGAFLPGVSTTSI